MPKKKRTKKDLIGDLALALEIAAIQNQFGGWGVPSPFQDVINRLLVESGRDAVKKARNPFKATRPKPLTGTHVFDLDNGEKWTVTFAEEIMAESDNGNEAGA